MLHLRGPSRACLHRVVAVFCLFLLIFCPPGHFSTCGAMWLATLGPAWSGVRSAMLYATAPSAPATSFFFRSCNRARRCSYAGAGLVFLVVGRSFLQWTGGIPAGPCFFCCYFFSKSMIFKKRFAISQLRESLPAGRGARAQSCVAAKLGFFNPPGFHRAAAGSRRGPGVGSQGCGIHFGRCGIHFGGCGIHFE